MTELTKEEILWIENKILRAPYETEWEIISDPMRAIGLIASFGRDVTELLLKLPRCEKCGSVLHTHISNYNWAKKEEDFIKKTFCPECNPITLCGEKSK